MVLAADELTSWNEDQAVIVLLRGKTCVQQGTVQVRSDQAVARLDVKAHRERGIWKLELYAEGHVRIDTSADAKEGSHAVVELATRARSSCAQ